MSTKIYNGFKFKQSPSLLELKQLASRFRAIILPIIEKKVNTFIANKAVAQIDGRILLSESRERSPLMAAIDELFEREREIKQTNRKDPLVDMEFNVCVLPTEHETYGIVYTVQSDLLELWLEQEEIINYPYWDNTDQPDSITWEDWEKRGEEWDLALNEHHGVPSMNGMTIEFVNGSSQGFSSAEKILPCVPTFEQRCQYWVKELAIKHATGQINTDQGSAWQQYSAAKEWLNTSVGKKYIKRITAEVKEKLPSIITQDMLLGKQL